jgi:hypothetical protein
MPLRRYIGSYPPFSPLHCRYVDATAATLAGICDFCPALPRLTRDGAPVAGLRGRFRGGRKRAPVLRKAHADGHREGGWIYGDGEGWGQLRKAQEGSECGVN